MLSPLPHEAKAGSEQLSISVFTEENVGVFRI